MGVSNFVRWLLIKLSDFGILRLRKPKIKEGKLN